MAKNWSEQGEIISGEVRSLEIAKVDFTRTNGQVILKLSWCTTPYHRVAYDRWGIKELALEHFFISYWMGQLQTKSAMWRSAMPIE